MDIFAQKKLLVRTVIVLVSLNLFSVGIFLWKGVHRRHEPALYPKPDYKDVSGVLKKELNLTDEQVIKINNLRSDFYEKENILTLTIRNERDSMNVAMFNKATDDSLVKSLARRVAENEYRMELLRFEQAKDLKTICTPEQLEKFQNLVLEIRDYFRPDNQHK